MLQKVLLIITFLLYNNLCIADNYVENEALNLTKEYNVPLLHYAIIEDNKVIDNKFISTDSSIPFNENSVFQAASISKTITAIAALILAEQGKISLDEDVNLYLKKWKIDYTGFKNKVTVRNLLNASSGINFPGFTEYHPWDDVPNNLQILNAEAPARNGSIYLEDEPDTQFKFTWASFQILQQLIEDVSKKSFPNFVHKNIFVPLKMQNSFFIIENKHQKQIIPGYTNYKQSVYYAEDNKVVSGGYNKIPEFAAGGLWSNAYDIALLLIELNKAYNGEKAIISKNLVNQMFTSSIFSNYGLGVVVENSPSFNIRKQGHTLGYHSQFIIFPEIKKGMIIISNSENGFEVIKKLENIIATNYNWPEHSAITEPEFINLNQQEEIYE